MPNPAPKSNDGGDIFDVKKVRQLIELMKEHDLAELDLKKGEHRVKIKRGGEPLVTGGSSGYAAPGGAHAGQSNSAPKAAEPAADAHLAVIKSPMVGTFYVSPNPDSRAFVKVGDHVGPDTIVCIIEAMKVFNEIPAEMSGRVAALLVENGAAVDFGQPLFKIDTRK